MPYTTHYMVWERELFTKEWKNPHVFSNLQKAKEYADEKILFWESMNKRRKIRIVNDLRENIYEKYSLEEGYISPGALQGDED